MSSSGGDPSEDRSFAEALPALKQDGCSVLVVGAVPGDVHEHACERLLGDTETETRRRVIVRGESTDSVGMAVADDDTRVVQHSISARASAVGAGGGGSTGSTGSAGGNGSLRLEAGPTGPGDGSSMLENTEEQLGSEATPASHGLAGLREELLTTVEAVAASAGTLSAAELRVCLDSLVALVDAHDHDTVTRLLRPVFAAVRDERGMVHGHLPVARDAAVVETLEPLFDAIVELRVELGRPQQRWHLREGPSSAWLPLQSSGRNTRGGGR